MSEDEQAMAVTMHQCLRAQGFCPAYQLVGGSVEEVEAAWGPADKEALGQNGETGEVQGEGGAGNQGTSILPAKEKGGDGSPESNISLLISDEGCGWLSDELLEAQC